ncbi:MAG: hypothetical protein HY259_14410 [Chloroflexi bacterium]|nr:hypothetical protein [Chloroflexota bacterium]
MELRIACLADYAGLSIDRKLNIMGVFSNIFAPNEPIIHPQMYVVFQLDFEPAEAGRKAVKIVLQDADGRELVSMGGEIEIGRPTPGQRSTFNQIAQMNGTVFPKFGQYEICILINGRTEATIPLNAIRAEQPARP